MPETPLELLKEWARLFWVCYEHAAKCEQTKLRAAEGMAAAVQRKIEAYGLVPDLDDALEPILRIKKPQETEKLPALKGVPSNGNNAVVER